MKKKNNGPPEVTQPTLKTENGDVVLEVAEDKSVNFKIGEKRVKVHWWRRCGACGARRAAEA